MRYMGSKNKIAKEIVPIIQSYIKKDTNGYLEPFCGGCNIIDKIDHENKIAYDINKYLIELLKKVQCGANNLPNVISEEEYKNVKNNIEKYEDWYVGFVGFCASFGAKFFGGYARNRRDDNSGSWSAGAIKNLKKQSENLKNIKFECKNFIEINPNDFKNFVIYCDIPYRNTTKYNDKNFSYEDFYKWCREIGKNNTVLISEYWMPEDFDCIWEKEVKILLDSNKNKKINKERLFIYNK